MHPGLRSIDCGGGGSGSGNSSNSLKKLFLGLLSNSGEESSNSGSSRRGARDVRLVHFYRVTRHLGGMYI